MTIREANTGDIPALMELYLLHLTRFPPSEPQDETLWIAELTRIVSNPGYHILITCENGRALSSVTVVVIPNLTHNLRPYAVIENVVTHADYRNRGFASALMERAVLIAREANCYKVMLMTGSKKESTLKFYERCGFDMSRKTAFDMRL